MRSPDNASNAIEALKLLAEADNQVAELLRGLLAGRKGTQSRQLEEAVQDLRAWLRVSILFPDLLPQQQAMLVTLYWHRQMLTKLVNVRQAGLSAPLLKEAERLTTRTEEVFMNLVKETLAAVQYDSMSPVEQIVFREEYVRIGFCEPAS